jgi:hypothetical protein
MEWYRVVTSYFVCAIVVKGGIVIDAAPIMQWSKGKSLEAVKSWVEKKKGTIEKL